MLWTCFYDRASQRTADYFPFYLSMTRSVQTLRKKVILKLMYETNELSELYIFMIKYIKRHCHYEDWMGMLLICFLHGRIYVT